MQHGMHNKNQWGIRNIGGEREGERARELNREWMNKRTNEPNWTRK